MQFQCDFSQKPNVSVLNIQLHPDDHEPQPFWRLFEYRLNTVWRGLAAEALFWAYIYLLWTGVGTCTRTHYARMRAQKKGLRCPSPDAPWAAACFPVYGAFFDVFGTFPVCRYKGWSTQVKRTSQFWASNLGRNHHKIQAKSPFWDVWFLLHIHVKISLIPLFTRLPAYILRVTQRDVWY